MLAGPMDFFRIFWWWSRLLDEFDTKFFAQSNHHGVDFTDSPGKVVKQRVTVVVACRPLCVVRRWSHC